ncbi:MAG: tRNA (N(6)-L-threonylcarbamoyladenosine(37)-C(2))-methylthiotransferase MtaB [Candidatus Omnitrophica bacterium]|nr:tRNA (N(6)-L-threonylcarbamoyladenosine(37)-C(2))-methylthiotransferase MtaB [Candidatus Omnitrophota bacterium]
MKTVKFYTLGCKVNQYDTQLIREQFMRAGFRELEDSLPASVYVINSCTVTQRADSESLTLIRKARRENPKARILVTGCLTELDGDMIKNTYPKATIVKNTNKKRILDYLPSFVTQKNRSYQEGISFFRGHTRVFLKIQDGCDNHCSYCKVPLVRGTSRSRPLEKIIREAERLVSCGFKEIVLTGICLGSYGKDLSGKINLCTVIDNLEAIDGVLRIRLSSIEAGDISDGLIARISASRKLCPHLHIPLQSGDDEMLKKMNRRYTGAEYFSLIRKIRAKIPAIAITTDLLVGFPGETEKNFQNTISLLKKVKPLKTHIFSYSEREGTIASRIGDCNIPKFLIKERFLILKKITDELSRFYKKQFLGKKISVLIEGRSKTHPYYWEGYTDNYIKVFIDSEMDLGNKLVLAKAKTLNNDYLIAKFLAIQ